MTNNTIEQDYRAKVSAKVRLTSEGVDRYRVFTPFRFDDGDHLSIVLKKVGTQVGAVRRGAYLHASHL